MRTIIAISLLVLLAAVACGTETPEGTTKQATPVKATPVPSPTAEPTPMAEPTNTPDTEQSTKYDRLVDAAATTLRDAEHWDQRHSVGLHNYVPLREQYLQLMETYGDDLTEGAAIRNRGYIRHHADYERHIEEGASLQQEVVRLVNERDRFRAQGDLIGAIQYAEELLPIAERLTRFC